MESTLHKSKFMTQVNNSFGSGGMSLALNEAQFAIFIQYLKQESRDSLTIRKAVTRIGQQPEKELWVLDENVQIDSQGVLVPQSEQVYTWLGWSVQQGLGNVSLKEVLPTILTPLGTTILARVIELLRTVLKHNFILGILMVAGGVMALHYSTIIQCSGCPTVIANGVSQTGKSTALAVALSIMGTFTVVIVIGGTYNHLFLFPEGSNV